MIAGFCVLPSAAIDPELQDLIARFIVLACRRPPQVAIEPIRARVRVAGARQEQSLEPQFPQVIDDHLEQAFADPLVLICRQQCEHGDLAAVLVSEAVAHHLVVLASHEAWAAAIANAAAPGIDGDAQGAQVFFGERVFSGQCPEGHTGCGIFRCCGAKGYGGHTSGLTLKTPLCVDDCLRVCEQT